MEKHPATDPEADLESDGHNLAECASEILEGLSDDKKEEIFKLIAIQKSHRGLLPPPEMLEHYTQIIPNGADRLMVLAEKQVEHRIMHETRLSKGIVSQGNRGQTFAFILGLSFIAGAVYLSATGKELSGIFMGFFGISGLVGAFLRNTLIKSDGGD